jgi:hypothetical protein
MRGFSARLKKSGCASLLFLVLLSLSLLCGVMEGCCGACGPLCTIHFAFVVVSPFSAQRIYILLWLCSKDATQPPLPGVTGHATKEKTNFFSLSPSFLSTDLLIAALLVCACVGRCSSKYGWNSCTHTACVCLLVHM